MSFSDSSTLAYLRLYESFWKKALHSASILTKHSSYTINTNYDMRKNACIIDLPVFLKYSHLIVDEISKSKSRVSLF